MRFGPMSSDLRGKSAVITGAASGIGRALALGLHREGMRLLLADIDLPGVELTCAMIREDGGEAQAHKCDVSKEADIQALAAAAVGQFGQIDLVINNAGIGSGGLVEELSPAEWEPNLNVNLWSIVYAIHAFLPHMIAQGHGHFVNVGSGAGIVGIPYHIPYVVSKFAVTGATEALYSELRATAPNIAVSVICPFFLNTRIIDRSELRVPARMLSEAARDEVNRRMDEFKTLFWEKYTRGALPVGQAAARYIAGIKRRRLYIFDNPQLRVAMFLKSLPGPFYGWALASEERRHIRIIRECFREMGIPVLD